MKVKVRRSYLGAEGKTHRGQELDISEARFRQLTEGIHLNHPLVDAMEVGYKMQPLPKNKMELDPKNKRQLITLDNKLVAEGISRGVAEAAGISRSFKEAAKEGAADPTPAPPSGGQIGEVSAASLSELDPAPARRRYTRRAAKPE